jgi:hypothetical protein
LWIGADIIKPFRKKELGLSASLCNVGFGLRVKIRTARTMKTEARKNLKSTFESRKVLTSIPKEIAISACIISISEAANAIPKPLRLSYSTVVFTTERFIGPNGMVPRKQARKPTKA